jgi:hypothetical protein
VLTNAKFVSLLNWAVLYELSRLDPAILAEKIAAGAITPRLKRGEVRRKVLGEERSERKRQALNRVRDLQRERDDLQRENDGLKFHVAELEAARNVEPPQPEALQLLTMPSNTTDPVRIINDVEPLIGGIRRFTT